MSLNDDAMFDLQSERDSFVTPPSEAADQTDSTSVVVITKTGENSEPQEVTTTEDQIVKKIEDDNTKIAVLENDALKLFDLSDVSDQIMATETIDQIQADRIQEVTGELYEKVGSRQEFTAAPTSTNLRETRRFVTNFTADQIKDFEARATAFRDEECAYMDALVTRLVTKNWPGVKDMLEDLSYLIMPNVRDIAISRKFIYTFPNKDEKTGELKGYTDPDNLVETRLCAFGYGYGLNRIVDIDDDHRNLVNACIHLESIFSGNPILKHVLCRFTGNNNETYEAALRQLLDIQYEREKMLRGDDEIIASPRIIDILYWYSTLPAVTYIDKSLDGLMFGINTAKEIKTYVNEGENTSDKVRRYFNSLKDVNKIMNATVDYYRIVSDLGRSIEHVKTILDFFVKFMK